MTTHEAQPEEALGIAQRVAPEDLAVGDVVTVLRQVEEVWAWDCPDARRKIVVHRPMMLPSDKDAGVPIEVKQVCLPWVVGMKPGRAMKVLDVRRVELAKVDPAVWLLMDDAS